jgi:hypothetical protein
LLNQILLHLIILYIDRVTAKYILFWKDFHDVLLLNNKKGDIVFFVYFLNTTSCPRPGGKISCESIHNVILRRRWWRWKKRAIATSSRTTNAGDIWNEIYLLLEELVDEFTSSCVHIMWNRFWGMGIFASSTKILLANCLLLCHSTRMWQNWWSFVNTLGILHLILSNTLQTLWTFWKYLKMIVRWFANSLGILQNILQCFATSFVEQWINMHLPILINSWQKFFATCTIPPPGSCTARVSSKKKCTITHIM